MAHDRTPQVIDTFVALADTLSGEYEIGEFLHLLVERCSEVLEVAAGGVLLENPKGHLELAAATTDKMKVLEDLEISQDQGPCLDAYRNVEQVLAEDLRDQYGRWPTIAPHAVEIDLIAVFAFPLQLRGDCIGALNLYRDRAGSFHDDDIRLGQAFADVAAIGIMQERKITDAQRRADQLQYALDSRVIIEQAKGSLAARLDISTDEAFRRLRAYARSHNTKIHQVCRRVIDDGLVPD